MIDDQPAAEINRLVSQAQTAWLQHDPIEARTLLRAAVARDPNNAAIKSMLTQVERECRDVPLPQPPAFPSEAAPINYVDPVEIAKRVASYENAKFKSRSAPLNTYLVV